MRIIELVFAAIAIVGFLLKLLLIPGGGAIFTLGMSALMFMQLFLGYVYANNYNFKPGSVKKVLLGILLGIFLSQAIAGILFKWMIWPGYGATILTSLVGLAIYLFLIITDKEEYYKAKTHFVRLSAIACLLIITKLTPINNIIRLQNRNCPIAGETLIRAMETNDDVLYEEYYELRKNCELESRSR